MRGTTRRVVVAAGLLVAVAAAALFGRWIILIIGGTEATGYTTVVFLWLNQRRCTGTLIGDRWFVTAAHCVPRNPTTFMFVENEIITEQKKARCVRHEAFETTPYFDVALCELQGNLGTLPASPLADTVTASAGVTYVGYGASDSLSWQLLRRIFRVAPLKKKGHGTVTAVQQGAILIDGHGTEGGDSGGPVFVANGSGGEALAGILSCRFGPKHLPRAVDLTAEPITSWLDNCRQNFPNCSTAAQAPPSGAPVCGDRTGGAESERWR